MLLPERKNNVSKFNIILLTVFLICNYSVLVGTTQAQQQLAAKSFNFNHETVAMPAEWQNKSVTYHPDNINSDLVISLGQQTLPALKTFIRNYAKQNNLKIVIEKGSCGVSSGKLRRKVIDIGAFCCPLAKSDRLPTLQVHTIGIAAIGLITHPDNPVTNLSLSDARKVFQGKYRHWSELPKKYGSISTRKIHPVVRLHCKKRVGHWRSLLKNEDLFSPQIFEVGVIPDMIKQVAANPFAIGYETVFMLKVNLNNGKLKSLSINGVHPADLKKLADAKYPLYRTINLTTWKNNNKYALAMVRDIENYIKQNSERLSIVPVSTLRKAGWKFHQDELIAEPGGENIYQSSHAH